MTRYTHSGLKNTGAQSTNAIVATRVYDAYGMVRSATGTWSGPFGFGGDYGYQEDETGLRLLGHRYYDASTGRFLTRDPIKDGRNWYSYCDGDPINGADPTGLKEGDIFKSEKEALLDAAKLYGSGRKESGGYIYQNPDGTFSYTRAEGTTMNIDMKLLPQPPEGSTALGSWHSHPFSPGYRGAGIYIPSSDEVPDSFSSGDLKAYHNNRKRLKRNWLIAADGRLLLWEGSASGEPKDDEITDLGRWRPK